MGTKGLDFYKSKKHATNGLTKRNRKKKGKYEKLEAWIKQRVKERADLIYYVIQHGYERKQLINFVICILHVQMILNVVMDG